MNNQYFGKYRAIVVDVADPEKRGRIKVKCPKVLNEAKSAWCQPCVPYARDSGGDFVLPKLNDFVWVEFEDGDIRYPIYTGGLWAKNKAPCSNSADTRQIEFGGSKITLKQNDAVITSGTCTISMSSGVITISNGHGASITLSGNTISMTDPH